MIKLGGVDVINGSGLTAGNRMIIGQNVQGKPREVHPVSSYTVSGNTFSAEGSIRTLPFAYVTGGARRLGAMVVNSLLQSRLDTSPSTSFRLMQHRFSGGIFTLKTIVDKVTGIDVPSSIITQSDLTFKRRVEVIFGNNGSAIVATVDGVVTYQSTFSHVIRNNDEVTVVQIKSLVMVYVNDVFIHQGQHPSMKKILPSQCYAGLSTSSTGTLQSTGFKSFTVEGSTDYSSDTLARIDAEMNAIGSSSWWGIGAVYVDLGGPCTITLRDFAWMNQTTGLNRQFRILVNGNASTYLTPQNGGTISESGTITDGIRVELQAYSSANTSDPTSRTVKSGTLEIVKR